MARREIRVRYLAAAVACVSAAITAALVGLAVTDRIGAALPPGSELRQRLLTETAAAALVAGILALGASLLIGLRLGRRLSDRLVELRSGVNRLADGDPRPLPPAHRLDEVGALATAVARFAEARDRSFERLRRESDELSSLIDAVSEGIVQLDASGRIVRANRAARLLLGLMPGAIGQRIASVVRNAPLRSRLEEAAARRDAADFEATIDGRRIFVAARESAAGVVAVFVDLTELRRLEDVRRDFVANASHELKTPLTSIRGYAETLLDPDVPEETRLQFLRTIRDNAERLQRVVDDLLDLSRIESGRWRPDLQPISVAAAAEEAWAACKDSANRKSIRFELRGAASALVSADRFALGQIFTNLFENAIRYSGPGGRVEVWTSAVAKHVEIEVRDNGAGIPADAIHRIFERFYRVDPSRARDEGGTGLGLAIVKHLVESMGGSVSVSSELGRGTAVRVQLPAS